jgi:hypothetical protein
MIPLNKFPTTFAQKMSPEAWRNVAECAIARRRAAGDRCDWQLCQSESESTDVAFALASLAREPFPIVVADGIRHHGKVPEWNDLMIDRSWHVEQSVNGKPMDLPCYLETAVSDEDKDWQDLVCTYLQVNDDGNREFSWQRLDLAGENDLSGDIFAVAFFPADSPDWVWANENYLCVDGGLHNLDRAIAECGILETTIGWHVGTLADSEFTEGFDCLASGYSSNPTWELEQLLMGDSQPVWHHALGCFVGRLAGHPHPVRLHPETPCYGG